MVSSEAVVDFYERAAFFYSRLARRRFNTLATRIVGDNGLPLRFWKTGIDREDRWERVEGTWWIVPGKL